VLISIFLFNVLLLFKAVSCRWFRGFTYIDSFPFLFPHSPFNGHSERSPLLPQNWSVVVVILPKESFFLTQVREKHDFSAAAALIRMGA